MLGCSLIVIAEGIGSRGGILQALAAAAALLVLLRFSTQEGGEKKTNLCSIGFGLSILGVAVFAAGLLILGWSSHRATHTTSDELCGIRQAMAFQSGRATLPLDFFGPYIDPTSVCFARSPDGFFAIQGPGWPAVLAASSVSGISQESVPWMLAGITLFSVGMIGVLGGGFPVAIALMVSLRHNQFFGEISRSYWSHSLAMLCVAVVMLSVIGAQHVSGKRMRMACLCMAGVADGLLILTRPLVGLSIVAWLILSVVLLRRDREGGIKWKDLAVSLVGPLCGGLLYGLFNHFTTGNFFLSGYEYAFGEGHNPGFFRVSPNGVAHTPERAWMLLQHHVRHLLLFVVPSALYFVGAVVLGASVVWSREVGCALLLTLCMWLGAATYWDSSYFVGPRFYYESMVPVTVLVFTALWNTVRTVGKWVPSTKWMRWIEPVGYLLLAWLIFPEPPVH